MAGVGRVTVKGRAETVRAYAAEGVAEAYRTASS
jgi:hypothetical protein